MEQKNALREFMTNVRALPRTIRDSILRHGWTSSDRTRTQAVVQNFFLHIHSARSHEHSLRARTTLGLGIICTVLFLLLCATGVMLMFYYKPSVAEAHDSINDIRFVVPTGRLIRNVHRWGAQGMVLFVLVHMARVFYTSAYKRPREFNWMVGMVLLATTLGLSFTGYLLPWDQLAFWAVTIGSNIAGSPREITDALGVTDVIDVGGLIKEGLLGAHFIGQEALIRFYTMHVMILPLVLGALLGLHFWRIRKDGGLARPGPAEPPGGAAARPRKSYGLMAVVQGRTSATNQPLENTIPTWPRVFQLEAAVAMAVMFGLVALSLVLEAPLKEAANPDVPENPAKAPWYFLGLQELVSYSAFTGGMVIPGIVMIGLALIPYLDREPEDVGIWFSGPRGRRVALWSLLFGLVASLGILAFTVRFGWLRNWFPTLPQIVITIVNPGTVFVVVCALWSIFLLRRTNSTRMAAIGLFTVFLVCFVVLTYFATYHRGPNWNFYWSPADWPHTGH